MVDEQRTGGKPAPSRLARETEGRILGGVCTGLGRGTGIDPVVYRVGFAILVLANGQGVLLYVAAVLLMPAAPERPSIAEQLFRRRFDAPGALSILGALLAACVALGVLGSGFVGTGMSAGTVAVLTVFGLVLLVAHGRGVDLAATARSFPERVQGHPLSDADIEEKPVPVSFEKAGPSATGTPGATGAAGGGLPDGMIDLARYSAPKEPPPPAPTAGAGAGATAVAGGRCRDGGPPLASITLLGAMAAGAAVFPAARVHEGPQAVMIVSATALAVVGAGLVLGGWFRARGLAAAGTMLTCALLTSSVAAEAPPGARYGEVEWRPAEAAPTTQDYRIAAGSGRLDLTRLTLRPGQRMTVNAELWLGALDVTVPKGARVELTAKIGLGDLDLPGRTVSGPGARTEEVLEAEGAADDPPTIELRIRSRFGDVQVTRG